LLAACDDRCLRRTERRFRFGDIRARGIVITPLGVEGTLCQLKRRLCVPGQKQALGSDAPELWTHAHIARAREIIKHVDCTAAGGKRRRRVVAGDGKPRQTAIGERNGGKLPIVTLA
jgi:hypothetical protein